MTTDPIQRATEVLDDHQRFGGTSDTAYRFTCTCDRYGALYDHDTRVFAAHQAQVLADAGLLPTAPTVKTSRDAIRAAVWICGVSTSLRERQQIADAVLALLPGRTEAEVKAEALREAGDWLSGVDLRGQEHTVSRLLEDRADEVERGEGRG